MRGILKSGAPFIWLTGGALATSLLMIGGLLWLIATQALGIFWPAEIVELALVDGGRALGQVRSVEEIPGSDDEMRLQLQVGNRDLYGADFRWYDDAEVRTTTRPQEAVLFERREWGNFYGFVVELWRGEERIAAGEQAWPELLARLPGAAQLAERIQELERAALRSVNDEIEAVRLERRRVESRAAAAPR